MASQRGDDAPGIYAAKLVLLAGAYYASAKLGLGLAFETSSVTAIWPPAGIALTAFVLWGPRVWPGIALGALLANSWTGVPLVTTLGIACGNTLEGLVGAHLLRRDGFKPSLERIRDVLGLVVLAAVLSTSVSATIGVLSLVVGNEVSFGHFASVWRVWWLGDMGGDLLVAPVLMVAATHWPFTRAPGRPLEAVVLAGAVVGAATIVLAQDTNLAYLLFPLLIWAALRFWQPGAVLASLAVAVIAVLYTASDDGPFVRANSDESLLLAQTFVAVAGITVLILAAVMSERWRAEQAAASTARILQESLLPSRLPQIPSVETAAHFRPAGADHRVGGDFYDVFDAGDDSWAIVVGDVCGKGADAAAVTGLARYTMRAAAIGDNSPSRILTLLNEAMLRQRIDDRFCTVAYARLDLDGPGARLTMSTGGHPLPLLLRPDGSVETVGEPGMLLGVQENLRLRDHTVRLSPGDTLLLYTDGLTDAYGPGRMLSAPDIASLLGTCAGMSASEIADHIQATVLDRETSAPRDDIALLVVRMAIGDRDGRTELSIRLDSDPLAPAAAREAIMSLEGRVEELLLGDLQLLTSELVTNSVRHAGAGAGAQVELRAALSPQLVRVEVIDLGSGFEPPAPHGDLEQPFGWGLQLVRKIADRWGVESNGRTSVWFEIDRKA